MTKAGSDRTRPEAGDAGRYRIFGSIGVGGMGSVHIGRLLSSADFARTVAVKRPLPELLRDPEVRAHIRREARVASRVHHPNVVATLDVVEDGSELWVIMEYVHGPSLATLLAFARERREPVPLAIGVALVADALRGLEAVHGARDERGSPLGIIHRDVSPHNILCGMDGTARVADFGLARAEALTSVSRSVRFKGKLAYASPEQADLKPLTFASDLYSMGVVLWEVLTGRRLYQGTTPTEVLAQVLAAAVPAPSSLNPAVPVALDAIVSVAIARDPTQRFASALAMQTALKSVAPTAPVETVAHWLREFAGDIMAERDTLLREAERHTMTGRTSAAARAPEADPASVNGTDSTWLQPRREQTARPAEAESRDMRKSVSSIMIEAARSRLALSLLSVAVGASLALFAVDAFLSRAEPAPPSQALELHTRANEMKTTIDTSRAALKAPGVTPAQVERGAAPLEEPGRPGALDVIREPEPPSNEAKHTAPVKPSASRSGVSTAPSSCDPPYSVDADGIRHMRPGCQ